MVVKKRCDFCLKIKPDNFQAEEKVFNREFKDVLVKIAGVEATPEQLSNILTCFECAIALLQAEPIVLKARNLLTRLSKQKGKKKTTTGATNGDNTANQTLLEHSILPGDDSQMEEEDVKKAPPPPQKVTARRKSVAKKLVDSIIADELEGNPAASSTMAANASIIENKSTPKGTPKKKAKASPFPKSVESPKKPTKSEFGSNSQEQTNKDTVLQKPIKDKYSEKSENSQEDNNELIATPKKAENSQKAVTSPKKKSKRSISERSDNSQEEATEIVMPFKKIKENSFTHTAENSQESTNGVKECNNCGKTFMHLDRYESHVLLQKCKLAAYGCKHPDCSRRFFKLQKMLEHMQKKHPDMGESEMD